MTLTLQMVEELAPDQASLGAAKKLLADKKWSGQGMSETTATAWGECQGSGSKPYYVVLDTEDYGYKCTCPSRKFPCKHALALMWRYVNDQSPFVLSPAPQWVEDWLSRRRKTPKTANNEKPSTAPSHTKSINAISDEPILDEKELAKKQAAAAKRAIKVKEQTDKSITAGLLELENWLLDQLRVGVGSFLQDSKERTRKIAARLTDAKATNLAARLDELPALIFDAPKYRQPAVVFAEFGRLSLLVKAWLSTPDDSDVRRAIARTEDKDKVLQGDPLCIQGVWQVVGEQTTTKQNGLIAQATYLVRIKEDNTFVFDDKTNPNFALLLDYYEPSSGFQKSSSRLGSYMTGTLHYYPSQVPLRAFFSQAQTISGMANDMYFYQDDTAVDTTPAISYQDYLINETDIHQSYAQQLSKLPWLLTMPYVLQGGQIIKEGQQYWYHNGDTYLLLSNKALPKLVLSAQIQYAFILWQGDVGELLSVVDKQWGFLAC